MGARGRVRAVTWGFPGRPRISGGIADKKTKVRQSSSFLTRSHGEHFVASAARLLSFLAVFLLSPSTRKKAGRAFFPRHSVVVCLPIGSSVREAIKRYPLLLYPSSPPQAIPANLKVFNAFPVGGDHGSWTLRAQTCSCHRQPPSFDSRFVLIH